MEAGPLVRFHLVKALNKLRVNYPRLRFPRESVDAALIEETRSYYAAVPDPRDTEASPAGERSR